MSPPMPLEGQIAIVAGATRGAGRGIACALGDAGATVYCTGRSTLGQPSNMERPETIDETAALVNERGGTGIAVRVDHTRIEDVEALVERVRVESGRLDILVNEVWGGDPLTEFGKTFWEVSLEKGITMLERGLHSHLITSRLAVPLMLESPGGLVVEVTDGDSPAYRGNIFYDLVKSSVIRLAMGMAYELRTRSVTSVAVTPGFLRSEAVLDHFGVTEDNWQEAGAKDPNFLASETPAFVGRAIAALAADPNAYQKSGQVLSSWALAEEYGFSDADGRRPHWGRHFAATYGAYRSYDADYYAYLRDGPVQKVFPDWPEPPASA